MKRKFIPLALILLFAVFCSMSRFQDGSGPHGGTIRPADNYYIELKIFHSHIYAYLLDENLKPVNNNGIFCKIKFTLPDTTAAIIDASLTPLTGDGFILQSGLIIYQSCRIIFNVYGKEVWADFGNNNMFIQKKE